MFTIVQIRRLKVNIYSFKEQGIFKGIINSFNQLIRLIAVKNMSLSVQETINDYIKKHNVANLATTINGLPSITCLPYQTKIDKMGNEIITFKLLKNSIEYSQIEFNKNCCLVLGSDCEEMKIYGKAVLIEQCNIQEIFKEWNNSYGYLEIIPEKITLRIDNKKIETDFKQSGIQRETIISNVITEWRFWFRITRAPFFTATIMPILLGIVLAWVLTDSFSIEFTILTLTAGILIHAGTNLINDFYDQRTDNFNENVTPFNGGSQTIQLRLASQEKILFSAIMSFVLGIGIILVLIYEFQSLELLILLLCGIFLAYFYTAGPIKLSHHGLGEISNFLGYGPILTLSAWLIQRKGIYTVENFWIVLYWSFIPGLLLTLILIINEFQDFESDKFAGKRTLIVRIGKNKGKIFYNSVSILTYILILVGVILLPKYSLLGIVSLVGLYLFYRATAIISANVDKIEELLPANGLTVQNHSLTTLLLMIGFIATKVIIG